MDSTKKKLEEGKNYSFPMFGAAPQTVRPGDEEDKLYAFLHKQKEPDKVELLDADGEQLINYPEIETAGRSIESPENFILGGYVKDDGKFEVKDILRWNATELVDMPENERHFFLDKMQWNEKISRSSDKTTLEEFLKNLQPEDFPITIKEA